MLSRIYHAARTAFTSSEQPAPTAADDQTMVTTRRQSGASAAGDVPPAATPAASDVDTPTSARKRRRQDAADAEQEFSTPATGSKRRQLPLRARHSASTPESGRGRQTRASAASSLREAEAPSDDEDSGAEPEVFVTPAQSRAAKKSPQKAAVAVTPMPTTHKRFGSEEPVDVPALEEPAEELVEEEEDEDSDDDAPEVVTTQDAAQQAKGAARDAAKARQRDEAAERQKRRALDARLKDQAARKQPQEPAAVVPSLDKNNLPELLPLEYLEDEVDEPTTISVEPVRTAKKTKFVEETPSDRTVGLTTFRVTGTKETELLAPRASKAARRLKEDWIAARGMGGKARPMNKGFFVKR